MKSRSDFDPNSYAPVAERIRLFYDAHPSGRIVTKLVRRTRSEVVFKALVYRSAHEARAAATGWASEREGDGDINLVACLENTETSAIGRALANLGFTASRQRASVEEMVKVSRARVRTKQIIAAPPRSRLDDARRDVLSLLAFAARSGLSESRVESLKARVELDGLSLHSIERLEALLRRFVLARRVP